MTGQFRQGRLISGQDDDIGQERNVKLDGPTQSLRINNWVWNPTTMAWERMKQPTIDIGSADLTVSMGDVERLLADNYWKDQRMDWDGDDLFYKGLHTSSDASTSDANWYIFKYTWATGDLLRIQGPEVGSWDGREALF
jgi:hypothetical protein